MFQPDAVGDDPVKEFKKVESRRPTDFCGDKPTLLSSERESMFMRFLSQERDMRGICRLFFDLFISLHKDNVKSELTRNLQDKLTANVCDIVRLIVLWHASHNYLLSLSARHVCAARRM